MQRCDQAGGYSQRIPDRSGTGDEPDSRPGSSADTCQRGFGSDQEWYRSLCDRDIREGDQRFVRSPKAS